MQDDVVKRVAVAVGAELDQEAGGHVNRRRLVLRVILPAGALVSATAVTLFGPHNGITYVFAVGPWVAVWGLAWMQPGED